ncbi:MAG TPA: ferritin-like domain-containing protein [Acidimicrobiales bacterium]|nr:ferritin-like domain-containing protein [Acidimicrobiales bacterium]
MDDRIVEEAADAHPVLHRRKLLLGGGLGALTLVAAACGGQEADPPAGTGAPTTGGGAAGGGDDVATAKLAASLEVLAVNTYGAALEADLQYPPAVAEFATTARDHHQAALDAWNQLLGTLGQPQVTEPPGVLSEQVNNQFGQVKDVTGVAELALMLEEIAADTYLGAISTIGNPEALELATTIQPIDMQHVAVLHYVLGDYPVPDTFANTEQAFAG